MTVNIPGHFITQYTDNVSHLLQIKGGKFRSLVSEGTHHGESAAVVDQYGKGEMLSVNSRFQPMPRVDIDVDRRWVYPEDFEYPQMVDVFDKLRLMIDPQSNLVQSAVFAVSRQIDTIISDAFFADSQTGKNGGTTTVFDTTNHRVDAAVGAAADTGLNVDKVIRGKRLLMDAYVDVDSEEVFMAISPQQEEDLLRQTQVINTDYFTTTNAQPVLTNGRVTAFGGVNIVVSHLVPSNASYRLCPMWVKSGMHLGVWKDVSSRVDERADLSGVPNQLYTCLTMGATRVEEGRVIQIECTEA